MSDKVIISSPTHEAVRVKQGTQGPAGPIGPQGVPGVIDSNPLGITGAASIANVVQISQADYDNIVTPDSNILYMII